MGGERDGRQKVAEEGMKAKERKGEEGRSGPNVEKGKIKLSPPTIIHRET